jgi:predicted amidohydrolase
MKVATAAYPIDWLSSWSQFEDKLSSWVFQAKDANASLMVFPEYGAIELASLAGREIAGDLQESIRAVSDLIEDVDKLHAKLAKETGCYILAASAPVLSDQSRPVNRSRLFAPSGAAVFQDKQIMTRFEREDWGIEPGEPLQIVETSFGKLGILICYDSEFPLLGRALSDCDLILVPSCTEALAGYWRVRIGAMSRALEQQAVTIMSSTVGDAAWSPAVDTNVGAGGVFCPPDTGFPSTGVIAEGALNLPGWTFAEVDLAQIAEVRRNGTVLNRTHWQDQIPRDTMAITRQLR